MKRQDVLDNAYACADRRERATLTLYPVSGRGTFLVVYGRVIAVAEHYTSRRAPQIVLERADLTTMVIGVSMVKDFVVGWVSQP